MPALKSCVSVQFTIPTIPAQNGRGKRATLKKARGDDKTFTSESTAYAFSLSDASPVSTCAREQRKVEALDLSRRHLAQEFGVSWSVFLPVKGGVLEYGAGEEDEGVCASSANVRRVQLAQQMLLSQRRRTAGKQSAGAGSPAGAQRLSPWIDAP